MRFLRIFSRSISTALALVLSSAFLVSCGGNSNNTQPPPPAQPTFTSTAPTVAQEGATWSYAISATDPDGGSVSFALTTSPSGASLSAGTVTWTPTHTQSRTTNNFAIKATTSGGGTSTQAFTITPNGTIRATVINHAVTGNGLVPAPENLINASIHAIVPDGNGGFASIPGTGDANGNLTIPNVPAGYYWLNLPVPTATGPVLTIARVDYLWTSASDLDLGALRQGRPDSVPLTAAVTINPNVNLTVAPQASDLIAFLSPDAGPIVATSTPVTATPFTTPITQSAGATVDASKGDRAYLIHYSGATTPASNVIAMQEFLEDDSVVETSGGTVSLTGTMTPITPIAAHPVVNFSQFDALIPSGLAAGPNQKAMVVFDPLYSGGEGVAGGINVYEQLFPSAASDTDVGDISFGLVDPNDKPDFAFADNTYRSYTLNSIRVLVGNLGTILHTATMPSHASPLAPVLSAPASVTIEGEEFRLDVTGVSTTPTITWSAPAIGTPDSYRVMILNFGPPSSTGFMPQSSNLLTTETSLTIPPGIIHPGDQFIVTLAANSTPGTTVTTAPFRRTGEFSMAMLGSGLITAAGSPSAAPRNRAALPKGSTLTLKFGEDGRWIATMPRVTH